MRIAGASNSSNGLRWCWAGDLHLGEFRGVWVTNGKREQAGGCAEVDVIFRGRSVPIVYGHDLQKQKHKGKKKKDMKKKDKKRLDEDASV